MSGTSQYDPRHYAVNDCAFPTQIVFDGNQMVKIATKYDGTPYLEVSEHKCDPDNLETTQAHKSDKPSTVRLCLDCGRQWASREELLRANK